MQTRRHLAIVGLVAISSVAGLAETEKKVAAPWMKELNSEAGGFAPMPACELTFNMGWKDIANAAQMKVSFAPGDQVKAQAQFGSVGAARSLYAYDGEYAAVIDGKTLLPLGFQRNDKDAKEVNSFEVEFGKKTAQTSWNTVYTEEGKETEKREREWFYAGMHDPISAALFLRSQAWAKEGETYSLLVFTSKDPYLVKVTQLANTKRKMGDSEVDALAIKLEANRVNGKREVKPASEKLKSATFFFSADDKRIPLGVSAALLAGSVEVILSEYKEL